MCDACRCLQTLPKVYLNKELWKKRGKMPDWYELVEMCGVSNVILWS